MKENDITIRKATDQDRDAILEIAARLHDWFDQDAVTRAIPTDLYFHKTIVAEINNRLAGFLTYSTHEGHVYIGWLGVDESLQRSGIGTQLIKYLEKELLILGIRELKVETLSDKIDYEPYVRTRAFYEKDGFIKGETRSVISADGEELEMVTYVKNL